MRIHTKIGKIASVVPPEDAKTCFVFFYHQYNADFRPLILHRSWPLLKEQTCIFVECIYPQVSSSYVYSFRSYRVDKQTNKQTPPKTPKALRYDTTLGNNSFRTEGQRRVPQCACVRADMCAVPQWPLSELYFVLILVLVGQVLVLVSWRGRRPHVSQLTDWLCDWRLAVRNVKAVDIAVDSCSRKQ